MQSCSGGCSVAAQCTALCSPLPSSLHHPEHEHFFNHSRESEVEPSRGRVSHCSVCSHHAFPSPLDITMPHSSMSPALQASTAPPFSHSAHLFPQHCPFPPSQLCPVSNITFTYVTVSFLLFPSLHHNPSLPPSLPSHWMGRDFLFTMGLLILPY